ncbi:MAG: hypothetical protein J6X43_09665 [Bacteroidales bacterium]|nr:hypothetical protein [Bacteroidales bacterium]
MKKIVFFMVIVTFLFCSCSEEQEKVIAYHPNGEPAYVEYFTKADSINPVRTLRYYYNGEKQEEIHFRDGIKEGKNTFWYQNGEKMFEGNYENGQMNGTFTQWFDNGMIDYIAEYENGRPTGTWKYFRKDGSLISEQKMQ